MKRAGDVVRIGLQRLAVATVVFAGGCAELPGRAPRAPEPAVPPPARAPEVPPEAARRAPDLAAEARRGRRAAPIPTRPLKVRADCNFQDPNGYAGRMTLDVADANVRDFAAEIHIPRRGTCRFALPEFRQTRTLPNVELSSRSSRCVVRMWEQGSRVTVAFTDCADRCTGDAIDYLWPILADARTGSCG